MCLTCGMFQCYVPEQEDNHFDIAWAKNFIFHQFAQCFFMSSEKELFRWINIKAVTRFYP